MSVVPGKTGIMANRAGQARRTRAGVTSGRMTERGRRHTIQEWLEQPPERRLELIDGEFVEKAAPDFPHGLAQLSIGIALSPFIDPRPGGSGPGGGGWWFASEVDIQLGANGYRPDVAGWRLERCPNGIEGWPIVLRPDWICEVLSKSNRHHNTDLKLRRYHEAGVPHYWLLDHDLQTLKVFRHEPQGYVNVLNAERGQPVRAEPFDAIELRVEALLGRRPK